MNSIDFGTIAMIAIAGSAGHCIGMCGGFVIAYSSAKIDPNLSKFSQLIRHLNYNFGRVSAYTIMGLFFGSIGMLFTTTMEFHGALFILAGILMSLTGLAMFGFSKLLLSIEYSMSKLPAFKKAFSSLIKSQSIRSFFALGMLNGVFPCGFVYFFAAKAAASASPLDGALVMLVFGLATIPALAMLGQSVSFLRSLMFRQIMNRIAASAILLYGIVTIYYGLAFFFELPI
jgi:hypothetical protein